MDAELTRLSRRIKRRVFATRATRVLAKASVGKNRFSSNFGPAGFFDSNFNSTATRPRTWRPCRLALRQIPVRPTLASLTNIVVAFIVVFVSFILLSASCSRPADLVHVCIATASRSRRTHGRGRSIHPASAAHLLLGIYRIKRTITARIGRSTTRTRTARAANRAAAARRGAVAGILYTTRSLLLRAYQTRYPTN
jgi:hypothetical protein